MEQKQDDTAMSLGERRGRTECLPPEVGGSSPSSCTKQCSRSETVSKEGEQ